MKHVDFNLSVILNKLGFDEYTEVLYLKINVYLCINKIDKWKELI